MHSASMKLKNELTVGVTVTGGGRSDLNVSQNIINVTGNSGDLGRYISNLRHAISKETEYQNFRRIISYINRNIRYQQTARISAVVEYQQY